MNNLYVRFALAKTALEFVHPLIRNDLLNESGFREEYGFTRTAVLPLAGSRRFCSQFYPVRCCPKCPFWGIEQESD